jgi:hypothetical protein
MSLKHKFEIKPDDPFKNDKLKREEEAITLTNLVKNYADGFVLAINNEWGAGKTTFLKMWKAHLKLQGVESLYFNAWENDHQTDVLVALLSELKELRDKEKAAFDKIVKKAVPLFGSVALGAAKGLAATVGMNKVLEGAIDGAIEDSEKLLNAEIEAYSKRKQSLEDFRESLAAYASAIGGENPLVFIIDELDRCRPSYAVAVLEQIKHVFSVPGIVFVLAIDKKQLGHAIKGVYGSPGMDDVEYLRRFIDIEFSLPQPRMLDYAEYLYEYYGIKEIIFEKANNGTGKLYIEELASDVAKIGKIFQLNLRQLEKIMMALKISLDTFSPIQGLNPLVLVLLSSLRLKRFDFYKEIRDGSIGQQELINKLEEILPDNLGDHGLTVGILCFAFQNEKNHMQRVHEKLIIDGKDGIKTLRFDYGKFDPEGKYLELFEGLDSRMELYGLRLGRILQHLEYSRNYFNRQR